MFSLFMFVAGMFCLAGAAVAYDARDIDWTAINVIGFVTAFAIGWAAYGSDA